MSITEKCPICGGIGLVNRTRPGDAIVEYNIKCYGCGGRGWIKVSKANDRGINKRSRKKKKRSHPKETVNLAGRSVTFPHVVGIW